MHVIIISTHGFCMHCMMVYMYLQRVVSLLYHRLFEWIFLNVHMEDLNDDTRAVYLRGLHEVIH